MAGLPSKPVGYPLLGLFLDRPSHLIDPAGFDDCNNVRIALGRADSTLMGYRILTPDSLPVQPIRGLYKVAGIPGVSADFVVVGTTTDLLKVDGVNPPTYLTPVYVAGTAAASGTAVTGIGTAWNTSIGGGFRKNARAGDQIAFGVVSQDSISATWYTIASVTDDTHLTLQSSAGVIANGSYTIRQCVSSNEPTEYNPWSFELYPTNSSAVLLLATNGRPTDCVIGIGLPLVGPGGGVYESALPWQAGYLRLFKNMMVYGNLYDPTAGDYLPTSIANSDVGLPVTMNTGVAGQYIVSDGSNAISQMEVLGNTLVIFAPGPMGGDVIGANFVGAPFNFTFTSLIRGRGPIGGRTAVTFPDRIEFLAAEGEYRYNGLFTQPVNNHLWRGLMQEDGATGRLDMSRINRAYGVPFPAFGDVIWALPLIGDAGYPVQTAFVEHYQELAGTSSMAPFTKRDWPFAAAQASTGEAGEQLRTGDESGNLWNVYNAGNKAQNFNGSGGTPVTSYVRFPQRFVVGERMRSLVKRVYPLVEYQASGTVSVAVSLYDEVGGQVKITDTQTFDPSYAGNRFTVHYRRGRLAQVKISGTSGWKLDGYDWDVVPGGQR